MNEDPIYTLIFDLQLDLHIDATLLDSLNRSKEVKTWLPNLVQNGALKPLSSYQQPTNKSEIRNLFDLLLHMVGDHIFFFSPIFANV